MRAETKAASTDDPDECDGLDEAAEDDANELTLEAEACVALLDDEGEPRPEAGDRAAEADPPAAAKDEGEPAALNVGVTPPAAAATSEDEDEESRLARPKLGGAWPDGRRRRARLSWAGVEVEPVGGSVRWLWLAPVLVLLLLGPGAPSKRAPSSDDRRWSWTIIA